MLEPLSQKVITIVRFIDCMLSGVKTTRVIDADTAVKNHSISFGWEANNHKMYCYSPIIGAIYFK